MLIRGCHIDEGILRSRRDLRSPILEQLEARLLLSGVVSDTPGNISTGRAVVAGEIVTNAGDEGQTYVVNSILDAVALDGWLTLREAIEAANTNLDVNEAIAGSDMSVDVITFAPSLTGETIALGGKELRIIDDLEIQGLGSDQLAVDANGGGSVFYVEDDVTVGITGLTIEGGAADLGGGVANWGGFITLTDITVTGNSADWGGGIFNVEQGSVTLTDSMILDNSGANGGGVFNFSDCTLAATDTMFSDNIGSGIFNVGAVVLTDSTISANSDSGIYNEGPGAVELTNSVVLGNWADEGGGIENSGLVTLTNTVVSGNQAGSYGGGISNQSRCTLINATVSGNSANCGGGIYNDSLGVGTLTNSTVSDNESDSGGGIWNGGVLTLRNTAVAGNTAGESPDVHGVLSQESSHNFIGGVPMWAAVTDVDGTVLYYFPQPGSPLINKGDDTLAVDHHGDPLTGDQVGNPRISGTHVDIGSIEYAQLGGLPGDADENGAVDDGDYEIFVDQFGLIGSDLRADLDYNGRVDLMDFCILRGCFGDTLGAASDVADPDATVSVSEGDAAPVDLSLSVKRPGSATGTDYRAYDDAGADVLKAVQIGLTSAMASTPTAALGTELPLRADCLSAPPATSGRSRAEIRYRTVAMEHDLRPLSDEAPADEADLLTDILAESMLAMPL